MKDLRDNLIQAMLYEKLSDERVRCNLCARTCMILEGTVGFCKVRKNISGKLYSLNYAKACSAVVDPIGKKPLSHFNPGSMVMSIATVGCNFRCQFCDNWIISQKNEIEGRNLPPEKVVDLALEYDCQGISYTYTEPTIFFEYAYDMARLAHKKGLFNTFVTNGYMTAEAVKTIGPYLDAATVDFKAGGNREFYINFSSVPTVEPIYKALMEMKRNKIHIEITNLVIPNIGDSIEKIYDLARWISKNLGRETPFHLLRFHPSYKLDYIRSTDLGTMEKAYKAAKKAELDFPYLGNIPGHQYENTYCSKCGELLIKRLGFEISRFLITEDNTCTMCGAGTPIIGKFRRGSSLPFPII